MEFLVFLHPILSLIILFFHGHFYLLTHSDLDFSQSAVGHEYVAEVEKHSSQTDAARGFGGKYGVEKDRADKVSDNSLPVPPNSDHVGLPTITLNVGLCFSCGKMGQWPQGGSIMRMAPTPPSASSLVPLLEATC